MWGKQLATAIKAGELAKREIVKIYKTNFKVDIKKDNSPVTNADLAANKIITEYLQKEYPLYAVLSEESFDNLKRLKVDNVWVVDPLDGTVNFVEKNNEFTINIALVHKHKVVLGVVIIPMTDEVFYATRHGGAFYSKDGKIKQIHVSRRYRDIRVCLSRSHHSNKEELYYNRLGRRIQERKFVGSAIKACLIAKGEAELAMILSNKTKEWDTAASQIIVTEAGGIFTDSNGEKMLYNRKDPTNKNGYIILNNKKSVKL